MQIVDDNLILSASDLNNYLACPHLTTLDLARARGELDAEPERGADAELLAEKGEEHEASYLRMLRERGNEVVEIPTPYTGANRIRFEGLRSPALSALRALPCRS